MKSAPDCICLDVYDKSDKKSKHKINKMFKNFEISNFLTSTCCIFKKKIFKNRKKCKNKQISQLRPPPIFLKK